MHRIHRELFTLALTLAGATAIPASPVQAQSAQAGQDQAIVAALNETYAKFKNLQEGKNADYIPALAKVDPNIFGIALVTTDGKV